MAYSGHYLGCPHVHEEKANGHLLFHGPAHAVHAYPDR
jgi:hypothetical protein